MTTGRWRMGVPAGLAVAAMTLAAGSAWAHGIGAHDAAVAAADAGPRPLLFAYLGAKHMVTGIDHLLFLAGVVVLLRRASDVAWYATLFALGHSLTLLGGVAAGWRVDPLVVDAWIALSVVYKALDNLGAFERWFGVRPPPRTMVSLFGLVHGLGLASRVVELDLPPDARWTSLVAFNAGVEIGQLLALAAIWLLLSWWRLRPQGLVPAGLARPANLVLLTAGFTLGLAQLTALGGRP